MDFTLLEDVLERRKAAMDNYHQLQLKLLETLGGENPGMVTQLESELALVNEKINSQKSDLAPLMSAWQSLPKNKKEPHLKGKIGDILGKIGEIAQKIELNFKKQQRSGAAMGTQDLTSGGIITQNSIYLAN